MGWKRKYLVSLELDNLEESSHLLEELRLAGFNIEVFSDIIGVVTGTTEPENLSKIQSIRGVAAVDADQQVEIAPPNSHIQ